MNVICAVTRHRPSPDTISNAGHDFTRCVRCGIDLVSVEGAWATAPAGQRIVWKVPPVTDTGDGPEFRERSRLDRRGSKFSPNYKGKERRQSEDRRRAFGRRKPPAG